MPPLLKILRLNLLRYQGALKTLKHFSDFASKYTFMRHAIKNCSFTRVAPPPANDQHLIPLRLKPLGDRTIYCRSSLWDLGVVHDTFVGRYHLPPETLHPIHTILDLGSNIGLTMAHYAALFSEARILGIELDRSNYEVCKRNIEAFQHRCRIIHGAVWHKAGEVCYGGARESGYAIVTEEAGQVKNTVRAVTMESLIDELGAPVVDFVKVDIEGAEKEVLQNAAPWIQRVRCLKVEVHPEKASTIYTLKMCIEDLEKLGMSCTVDPQHHACVIARRPI
jgi:FkbM family methyltransferase